MLKLLLGLCLISISYCTDFVILDVVPLLPAYGPGDTVTLAWTMLEREDCRYDANSKAKIAIMNEDLFDSTYHLVVNESVRVLDNFFTYTFPDDFPHCDCGTDRGADLWFNLILLDVADRACEAPVANQFTYDELRATIDFSPMWPRPRVNRYGLISTELRLKHLRGVRVSLAVYRSSFSLDTELVESKTHLYLGDDEILAFEFTPQTSDQFVRVTYRPRSTEYEEEEIYIVAYTSTFAYNNVVVDSPIFTLVRGANTAVWDGMNPSTEWTVNSQASFGCVISDPLLGEYEYERRATLYDGQREVMVIADDILKLIFSEVHYFEFVVPSSVRRLPVRQLRVEIFIRVHEFASDEGLYFYSDRVGARDPPVAISYVGEAPMVLSRALVQQVPFQVASSEARPLFLLAELVRGSVVMATSAAKPVGADQRATATLVRAAHSDVVLDASFRVSVTDSTAAVVGTATFQPVLVEATEGGNYCAVSQLVGECRTGDDAPLAELLNTQRLESVVLKWSGPKCDEGYASLTLSFVISDSSVVTHAIELALYDGSDEFSLVWPSGVYIDLKFRNIQYPTSRDSLSFDVYVAQSNVLVFSPASSKLGALRFTTTAPDCGGGEVTNAVPPTTTTRAVTTVRDVTDAPIIVHTDTLVLSTNEDGTRISSSAVVVSTRRAAARTDAPGPGAATEADDDLFSSSTGIIVIASVSGACALVLLIVALVCILPSCTRRRGRRHEGWSGGAYAMGERISMRRSRNATLSRVGGVGSASRGSTRRSRTATTSRVRVGSGGAALTARSRGASGAVINRV